MLRDVTLTVLVLGLVPVCFARPLIGLLTFSWLAYMRVQDLTWGFARHQRWSFLIAAVTFAGFLWRPQGRRVVRDPRCWAMIALAALVGMSIWLGEFHTPYQWKRYLEFCKIIGVALFTTAVVTRREHLRVLVWVIALSLGFYGVKIGLAGILTLGRIQILQGPGGMLEDNNDFSLALCMALPLLLEIGASERTAVLRRGAYLMVPLTILTVILTHSRGGFLALVAVIGMLAARSRQKLAWIAAVGVIGFAGLLALPDTYIDRIRSIADYQNDPSAMGRIRAWGTAMRMIEENPFFGVGFNMFQAAYGRYQATDAETARVAHNSYLQIWAECGTFAFIVYLFLILETFRRLWRVRREARRHYHTSWIINYATMFEVSMVAFVIGGVFLNRAHFDLFYHFVAIAVSFEVIAYREMRALAAQAAPARGRVGSARPERRGFGAAPRRGGFRGRRAFGGAP